MAYLKDGKWVYPTEIPTENLVGRVIKAISLDNSVLHLRLGYWPDWRVNHDVTIWDDGQQCCETRWMSCDDDLSQLIGQHITSFEVRDGSHADEKFLVLETNKGFVTFVTHNDHNGYYGGFAIKIAEGNFNPHG